MWEYHTAWIARRGRFGNIFEPKMDPEVDKWLSEMGAKGWELVSVSPRFFGGVTQGDVLYFKRRIEGLPTTPAPLSSSVGRQ